MCWPCWKRVPRALNRAIFSTFAHGPREAYRANVVEAVRIVEEKQRADREGQA